MAIAPLPAGRLRALSELSNLDATRQHALANALMLASHPWLMHRAELARPPLVTEIDYEEWYRQHFTCPTRGAGVA